MTVIPSFLLHRFENGRVYKFFPGRLISVDEICEDSHRRYNCLHVFAILLYHLTLSFSSSTNKIICLDSTEAVSTRHVGFVIISTVAKRDAIQNTW